MGLDKETQVEFGDKNTKGKPREKIRGSQFVKREEKIRPKLTIRNPFEDWKKNNPRQTTPPPR